MATNWSQQEKPLAAFSASRRPTAWAKSRRHTSESIWANRLAADTMYVPPGWGVWLSFNSHSTPSRSACNLMYTQTCFGQEWLQTILGYCDMLLAETGSDHPFREGLEEIRN